MKYVIIHYNIYNIIIVINPLQFLLQYILLVYNLVFTP